MEGLEASVLPIKKWREDNAFSRLDSGYQIKAHLKAIELVKQFGAVQFKDDQPEIIHPQEIKRQYVEKGGIWFLRAQNVRPMRIDPTNQVLISKGDAVTLSQNEIEADDVLITRTGANRGECAIYDRKKRAIASSHTFIIRPKKIDPQFLAVFLNSRFGKIQIDRGVYGAAQPEIAPYYLLNIWLPTVSASLIARIKSAFDASKARKMLFEVKQKEAEDTLLAALGLEDWTPLEPLSHTVSLSDIMGDKRLDAQFYRPKFKELQAFHQARFELQYLHGFVLKGRTVPYSDVGTVPIIRSGDLTDIDDEDKLLRADASEPIFFLKKGDVLISSIGFGSIGKIQVFDKELSYGTVSEVTVVSQRKLGPLLFGRLSAAPKQVSCKSTAILLARQVNSAYIRET